MGLFSSIRCLASCAEQGEIAWRIELDAVLTVSRFAGAAIAGPVLPSSPLEGGVSPASPISTSSTSRGEGGVSGLGTAGESAFDLRERRSEGGVSSVRLWRESVGPPLESCLP